MKKSVFIGIGTLIVLWFIYGSMIKKISQLEKTEAKLSNEIRMLEKSRNEKIYIYDKQRDLKSLEQEMLKQNMVIADRINFITVEE